MLIFFSEGGWCLRIYKLRFHRVKSTRPHLPEAVPPVGRNYPEVVHGPAKDPQGFPVQDKVPIFECQGTCATVDLAHSVSILRGNRSVKELAQWKILGLCAAGMYNIMQSVIRLVKNLRNINSHKNVCFLRILMCFFLIRFTFKKRKMKPPPPHTHFKKQCYVRA